MPKTKIEAADLSPIERKELATVEAVIDREVGLQYVRGGDVLVSLSAEAQGRMRVVLTERLCERVRFDYRMAGWRVSIALVSGEGEIRLW